MSTYTDYSTLHEGFLKDIFDLLIDDKFTYSNGKNKVGKSVDLLNILSFKDRTNIENNNKFDLAISKNIAKASKGLTATFPVVVTEAVPLDQAIMVSKVIERKCVEMLQMLFASNQITNAKDAFSYLGKFHNNLDPSLDWSSVGVDDVINLSNEVQRESTEYDNAMIDEAIQAVIEDCKHNCNYRLEEGINENSIGEYRVKKVFDSYETTHLNEVSYDTRQRYQRRPDGRLNFNNPEKLDTGLSTNDKNVYDMLNKTIIKSDLEKANEAIPSLIIINFVSNQGKNAIRNTCVIGVKAIIHYVSSEDMVNKIVLKNSDRRGLFNFIRATTREISFFKDFLFAVDRAKIDALSKVGKGSSSNIWKLLELRANEAKRKKAAFKNDASCSAIATIVVSSEEADLIKKQYRIDIRKPGTLLSIMRGYSFMCGVIVDGTDERTDFIWDDGSNDFETYSFMSLEREQSQSEYKKVINMMMSKGR